MTKTHECEDADVYACITYGEYFDAKLRKNRKSWLLKIEDYGDCTLIKYCPYCGVNLDE